MLVVGRRRAVHFVDGVDIGGLVELLAATKPKVSAVHVALLGYLGRLSFDGVQNACHDGTGGSCRQGGTCEWKSVLAERNEMSWEAGSPAATWIRPAPMMAREKADFMVKLVVMGVVSRDAAYFCCGEDA